MATLIHRTVVDVYTCILFFSVKSGLYVCVHVCVHLCVCMHVCVYGCVCVCACMYMYVCACVYGCVCVCACMYVCACMCVCVCACVVNLIIYLPEFYRLFAERYLDQLDTRIGLSGSPAHSTVHILPPHTLTLHHSTICPILQFTTVTAKQHKQILTCIHYAYKK